MAQLLQLLTLLIQSDKMAIPIPTVDDFTESTVMQECRAIVDYIINTLVPAINEGGGGSSYVLPPATKSTLGGVIVGDNLTVDGTGKVNGPAPYTLPVGGTNIGGVKNGGNVTIESDGTMNASSGGSKQIVSFTSLSDFCNYMTSTATDGDLFILDVNETNNSWYISTAGIFANKNYIYPNGFYHDDTGDYPLTRSGIGIVSATTISFSYINPDTNQKTQRLVNSGNSTIEYAKIIHFT